MDTTKPGDGYLVSLVENARDLGRKIRVSIIGAWETRLGYLRVSSILRSNRRFFSNFYFLVLIEKTRAFIDSFCVILGFLCNLHNLRYI